jgi:hypothetical protein
MRLDRVLSEGEAQVVLRRLGFDVRPAPLRPGLFEITHASIGGQRTVNVEQLCFFAEGATAAEQLLQGEPARQS